MKKFLVLLVISIVLICFTQKELFSQGVPWQFDCYTPIVNLNRTCSTPFKGYLKPNTTEWNGPNPSQPQAYFPVLVVFVQFADDPPEDPSGTWPLGGDPSYLNTMIATQKGTNGGANWWLNYNPQTESISSYWMEMSRGKFHVISPFRLFGKHGAFSVKLGNASSYQDMNQLNEAIWRDLNAQGLKDWSDYDHWKYNSADNLFYNEPDGKVDFIYKIHRCRGRGPMPDYAGYNVLGGWGQCLVDTVHNIYVDYSGDYTNSGATISFRGTKFQYIGCSGHEHGHSNYMGGHITNSRECYGIGPDFFSSPYDMILQNYMTPQVLNTSGNVTLGDYSSRTSNLQGEILQVPIPNTGGRDESFLIANRRKVSTWDRLMLGDTAEVLPIGETSDYGKGVYIYHVKNGIHQPMTLNDTVQDMECADGYWSWELKSSTGIAKVIQECFVSNPNWLVYQRSHVLYTNDPSTLGAPSGSGNAGNPNPWGDGLSFFYNINNSPRVSQWGIGSENLTPCSIGTDRIFTNDENIYFNGEYSGSRYDAWNVGYNEVFSPYSSPSIVNWDNSNSGLFIWYNSLNGNDASIKVYRASEYGGDIPLDSILKITPPSKPMELKIDATDCIKSRRYPVLTWNHNMEPDMLNQITGAKRYKIYRAYTDMKNVPGDFTEIADIQIRADRPASYIDYSTYGECINGTTQENYHVRYRIKAVDIYDSVSVFSDFVSTCALYLQTGQLGGNGMLMGNHGNTVKPDNYSLSQNYPNPFNPVTRISYAIPNDGFVTLKVYDIIGREVAKIINETKTAGYYTVDFDASKLASGIYFYKLQSGSFTNVKRMVLVK